MLFLPNEIMMHITEFLGENYWVHRQELTHLNRALDLATSDYARSAYWSKFGWDVWRKRNAPHLVLRKPRRPERFDRFPSTFIISLAPPEVARGISTLFRRADDLRVLVHW